MTTKKLIILRGVAGAGKSTFAKLLEDSAGAIVCSADNYMVDKDGNYKFDPTRLGYCHSMCKDDAYEAMYHNHPVIVLDNTNTRQHEFQSYETLAKGFDYEVTHLIVENRHGNSSVHGVPEETTKQMRERFEVKL